MKIVSPFLKRVLYPSLSMAGIFRAISSPGLAVVTYHGVRPPGYETIDPAFDGNLVRSDVMRRQLGFLKAKYTVISPDDALAWIEGRRELPFRAVLLTCDDGLLNCLTDMLPVLQEEGLKCLFFVTGASTAESRATLWYEELFLLLLRAPAGAFEILSEGIAIQGTLGSREERRAIWWDSVQRLSQVNEESRGSFLRALRAHFGAEPLASTFEKNSVSCRRFGLLTSAELRELAAAGMTIGAHTLSHPMLSLMPPDLAYAEISESRTKLESVLQERVWAFAYPFGDPQSVTPQVLAMPQEAGYKAAFLNFRGGLGTELPPYALRRVHVTEGMSVAELDAHVSGFYARLQRGAGRRAEIVETRRG
jgi:peptidoglycan/xylan/chitin deacetylase (PgdA/CDA1 family)